MIQFQFVPQEEVSKIMGMRVALVPVSFDATAAVLKLNLRQIHDLVDGSLDPRDRDNLAPLKLQDEHSGPFEVEVDAQEVLDYFKVGNKTQITTELLEQARRAHEQNKKTYEVVVDRVVVQRLRIEVKDVVSEDQAYATALNVAGDINFHDGTQLDPEYVVSDLYEVEVDEEEEVNEEVFPTYVRARG